MSINSLQQFDAQLLLKLTLGQQFQQSFNIPDVLKDYAPSDFEKAEDVLKVNQSWVLMQQAGRQAVKLDEDTQQLLIAEPEQDEFIPQKYYPLLENIINSSHLGDNEVHKYCRVIFELCDKSQRLPHHLFYALIPILSLSLRAERLPERAYQLLKFESNNRIKAAQVLRQCLQQGDAEVFLTELRAATGGLKSQNETVILLNMLNSNPDLFQRIFIVIAEKGMSFKGDEYFNRGVPLTVFDQVYPVLRQKDGQSLGFVKAAQVRDLYLYHQDNFLSQQALQLFKQCVSEQKGALLLDLDVERDEQLQELGLLRNAMSGLKRTEFKASLDDPEKKKKFLMELAQGDYLHELLTHSPLAFWQELFYDWSELLNLRLKAQKNRVLDAFAMRCAMENRVDLANWIYPHLKQGMKKELYLEGFGQTYIGLLSPEHFYDYVEYQISEQLAKDSYAGFNTSLAAIPEHFYPYFAQQKDLTEQIMQMVISFVPKIEQAKSDSVKTQLQSIVEWLMLYGYPIDFKPYKALIPPLYSKILLQIVAFRQQSL